jgi:hypothetical protein
MSKWADYGICKVHYDNDHDYIETVKIREDLGDSIGSEVEKKRSWVVKKIEDGTTFVTILKNEDGKWEKGQDVHIVTVNGKKYIRTDQNDKDSDNLENLPEY